MSGESVPFCPLMQPDTVGWHLRSFQVSVPVFVRLAPPFGVIFKEWEALWVNEVQIGAFYRGKQDSEVSLSLRFDGCGLVRDCPKLSVLFVSFLNQCLLNWAQK